MGRDGTHARLLRAAVLAAVAGVAAEGGMVLATCDDPAAVCAARADVDAQCDCAGAPTHGAWTRCAGGVIRARVLAGMLPRACRTTVRACVRRSTCGRPGWVTCWRSRPGRTTCSPKRTAALCTPPADGIACAGTAPSCCDACTGETCGTSTSTTTSSSTTTIDLRPTSCAAVPQPPGSCTVDESCPSDYACIEGVCRAGACSVRADCPAGGECVLGPDGTTGACVCRGCDALSCPLACRQGLVLTGCVCESEHDCPDEDDVCFLSVCS